MKQKLNLVNDESTKLIEEIKKVMEMHIPYFEDTYKPLKFNYQIDNHEGYIIVQLTLKGKNDWCLSMNRSIEKGVMNMINLRDSLQVYMKNWQDIIKDAVFQEGIKSIDKTDSRLSISN